MKKAVLFDFYGVMVNEGHIDPELVATLYELKEKGIMLLLISNANEAQSKEQPQEFPAIEVFDKRYYSWQIGVMKPDPRTYEFVLKDQKLEAKDVLYFDDHQAQVDSANSLGIESYLYESAQQVREKLGI